MLLLITYLVSLGLSEITCENKVLTITNEATISSDKINSCSSATSCVINSNVDVSIQSQAFSRFVGLEHITAQVPSISFEDQSFQNVIGIGELKVTATNTITLGLNAFIMAEIDTGIQLQAGNKIIIGQASFQQVSISGSLTLISDGTIELGQNAFQSGNINSVSIQATNDVQIGQQAFQSCDDIINIDIESKNAGISFSQSSFMSSTLNHLELKAHNDIILGQQSMQQVKDFNDLIVITEGNFNASFESFISSSIRQFYIECKGTASFAQQTFQDTPRLANFTVIADKGIIFAFESFYNSNVTSMVLETNGPVTFAQQAFQQTKRLLNFSIQANGNISFGFESFYNSNVRSITLNTNGAVNFSQQSFQECRQLNSLNILSTSDVSFGFQSFLNSQIHQLGVTSPDRAKSGALLLDSKSSTITFGKQSFGSCNELTTVNVNTKSNVNVQPNSFQNSQSLSNVVIKSSGKATVGENAFSGCSSLDEAQIEAPEKDVSPDAYGGGGGSGKKKGGSSHSDDDDENELNAKTLGNFEIKTVYLGTSPNIVFNLNFVACLLRKARKMLGKVLPPPDLIHTAIWVGKEDANDDSLGAIFVYGKYYNRRNLPSYLDRDGAKGYVMSLRDFKKKYHSIEPMKLDTHENLNLFEFIEKVMKGGRWRAKDYNWPTNNCQHFTAKLIDILKATRNSPSNNDWIDLPKPVLNSLNSNEQN